MNNRKRTALCLLGAALCVFMAFGAALALGRYPHNTGGAAGRRRDGVFALVMNSICHAMMILFVGFCSWAWSGIGTPS